MPPRGLPGNANVEQLKKGAKSFQRAVRAGDGGAAEVVREFHPRLSDAQLGTPALERFTRADAQLVIARQFGFSCWPKLKAHLELVERYARSPHQQPIGGALGDEAAIVEEFLRLACVNYGDDDPDRWERARELLDANPWLARASIYTAAAVGDVPAARELLTADPTSALSQGGPHAWEPLLYLTYSRVPIAGPGRSAVQVARLLLQHGADPNAGYLWEGLVPPFTALTGVFGNGEGVPPAHRDWLALARLLLEAGADANDGQTLYNRGRDPDDRWLGLLLQFGLGGGDGGPWRRLLGDNQDSPREMLEDVLMAAARQGFADRVRLLIARGVNPEGVGSRHPIYDGRSPVQEAALWGHTEVVSMLVEADALGDRDNVDMLLTSAMAGDHDAVDRLLVAEPGLRELAIERQPDQLVRAAEKNSLEAVALLIELGFDVNATNQTAPLHEAAMRGNLPVIRLLLEHGADPNACDVGYKATPAGWAEHHGHTEAERYLRALEDRP